MPEGPIRVGVSSCLLGREVRWDGNHKKDSFLVDELARFVELVPVCPELEVGMGVPREPVRLVRIGEHTHMRGVSSEKDHTEAMRRWARQRIDALGELELDGYVVKSGSPSCGLERVKLYRPEGGAPGKTRGLYTAALMEAMPLLPVEDEGRLHDAGLRECFVVRVFAHRRLRALFAGTWTMGDVVRFHTAEKLLLLAHSQAGYRALGKLVAGGKRAGFADEYRTAFMAALGKPATTRSHSNVLSHMAGYFKTSIDADDRRELADAIEDYRLGRLPLLAPLTLLKHHTRRHAVDYLAGQTYLQPHPKELMLRNRA